MQRIQVRRFGTKDWGFGRILGQGISRGGPDALLEALEFYLGCSPIEGGKQRTAQLAKRFATGRLTVEGWQGREPWSSAAALLRVRDELELRSESKLDVQGLPWLETIDGMRPAFGGVPDRIDAILAAIQLHGRPDLVVEVDLHFKHWPPRWATLLRAVDARVVGEVAPPMEQVAESYLADGAPSAYEWVASQVQPGETIVCDESDLMPLTESMRRAGIPMVGNEAPARDHPALQVLPILIQLAWSPVDTYAVHDLISLPGGPLSARTRMVLRQALDREAGFASPEWNRALDQLARREDGTYASQVERARSQFFDHVGQFPAGAPVSIAYLVEMTARIRKWAKGRFERSNPLIQTAVEEQLAFFTTLLDVEQTTRHSVDAVWLRRALTRIQAEAPLVREPFAAVGGVFVTTQPFDAPDQGCWWLNPDGYCRAPQASDRTFEEGLARDLGVELETQEGKARALALRAILRSGRGHRVLRTHEEQSIDSVFGAVLGATQPVSPERVPVVRIPMTKLVPEVRGVQLPAWGSVGPSVLDQLLGCNLRAVLRSNLRVRMGQTSPLSRAGALRGTLVHAVLEDLGPRIHAAEEDEVQASIARLEPIVAEPLLRPENTRDRQEAHRLIRKALELLRKDFPGAAIQFEVPMTAHFAGVDVRGSIDLLVDDGAQLVLLDLKTGKRIEYADQVKLNVAPQVAAYASDSTIRARVTDVGFLLPALQRISTGDPEKIRTLSEHEIRAHLARVNAGRILVQPIMKKQAERKELEEIPTELFKAFEPKCAYCEYSVLCGRKEVS